MKKLIEKNSKLIEQNRLRIEKLEKAFFKMSNNLGWHTKIGYYIATVITAIFVKMVVL